MSSTGRSEYGRSEECGEKMDSFRARICRVYEAVKAAIPKKSAEALVNVPHLGRARPTEHKPWKYEVSTYEYIYSGRCLSHYAGCHLDLYFASLISFSIM